MRLLAMVAAGILLLVVLESPLARAAFPSAPELEAPPPPVDAQPASVIGPAAEPRPVPLGEVTQAWDNTTFAPTSLNESVPVGFADDGANVSIRAPYGEFRLAKRTAFAIRVRHLRSDEETLSIFSAKCGDRLSVPRTGSVLEASAEVLSFNYSLHANGAGVGDMQVVYRFQQTTNKITATFSPAASVDPSSCRVAWLILTPYRVLETADPADGEEDIGQGDLRVVSLAAPSAQLWREHGGAHGIRLDFADAARDWERTYAGRFDFAGWSGNAVLISFAPGHLMIDPTLITNTAAAQASRYSSQRKTLFDGSRYWAFWYDGAIKYASSVDGKSWPTTFASDIPGNPTNLPHSFTVANFGKTLVVVWVADGKTAIRMATGEIKGDWIKWDSSASQPQSLAYTTADLPFDSPAVATFVSRSEIAVTWVEAGSAAQFVYLLRYLCIGTNGFLCSAGQFTETFVGFFTHALTRAFPVAFNGDQGYVAVFYASPSDPINVFEHWTTAPRGWCRYTIDSDPAHVIGEDPLDYLAATPSDQYISVFWKASVSGQYKIFQRDVGAGLDCPLQPENELYSGSFKPRYLSAGTEQDGRSVYLFWQRQHSTDGPYFLYYARVTPEAGAAAETPPWMPSYTTLEYITSAAASNRFIPLMYTSGTSLYFVNYPLPLDGESAGTPWGQVVGAPSLNDLGSLINPAAGQVRAGANLIDIPARHGDLSLSILYRQPALFHGATPSLYRYYAAPDFYGRILYPTIHPDLPWIDYGPTQMLHLPGGQSYLIRWDDPLGTSFDNKKGVHFLLRRDPGGGTYVLTLPSGARMDFDAFGKVTKVYSDATRNNFLTYEYETNFMLKRIVDNLNREIVPVYAGLQIDKVNYPGGRTVDFTYGGVPTGCTGSSSDSGTVTVTDVLGQQTTYSVCKHLLTRVDLPTGGKGIYTYAAYGSGYEIWQGTDVYSLPIRQYDAYSQAGAGVVARTGTYTYHVQNGEIVFTEAKFYDGLGAFQGAKEYRYRSHLGLASTRIYEGGPGSVTLRPNGPGSFTQWVKGGSCSANWDCVDDPTLDRFGSYVNATVTAKVDRYAMQDTTGSAAIASMQVYTSAHGFDGCVEYPYGCVSKYYTQVNGYNGALHIADWQFFTYWTDTWTTNPATGNPWTVADVNAMEVGVRSVLGSGGWVALSQLYVVVNFQTKEEGRVNNWYSVDDQPHLSEQFAGDESEPSATSQDFVDDWGNAIYSRDAYGNETFGSYANTNHQYQFYAPGLLRKTHSGKLYATGFDDYSFADWSYSGSASIDDTKFARYMPALKGYSGAVLTKTFPASTTNYLLAELNLRLDSNVRELTLNLGTTSGVKVRFTTSGTLQRWDYTTSTWGNCYWPDTPSTALAYRKDAWYRVGLFVNAGSANYQVYVNERNVCSAPESYGVTYVTTMFVDSSASPALVFWIDDVKISDGNTVTVSGLSARQSAALLAADGITVIDTKQTQVAGSVTLLFNPSTDLEESGANVLQILAADGSVGYQSPRKDIYGGDAFAYTQAQTFADELVRTRSGFGYWSTLKVDENPPPGQSQGEFDWSNRPAVSGSQAHMTRLDIGAREHWYTADPSPYTPSAGQFHVQYVYIPSGEAPVEVLLRYGWTGKYSGVYWGNAQHFYSDICSWQGWPAEPCVAQGLIPDVRNTWIQFLTKADDIDTVGKAVNEQRFYLVGGTAYWDASALASSEAGTLQVTGLGALPGTKKVQVLWAENDTLISEASTTGSTASVNLYGSSQGFRISAFPVLARIAITDGGSYRHYVSAPRYIWGGDIFSYAGDSGFYDPGYDNLPGPDVHAFPLGSRRNFGDCQDAIVCYDMESLAEGPTVSLGTGAVAGRLSDLSGKGNHGAVTGAGFSDIRAAGSGLGLKFDGVDDKVAATPAVSGLAQWSISLWLVYDNAQPSVYQHPIALGTAYDVTIYVNKVMMTLNVRTTNSGGAVVLDQSIFAGLTAGRLYHVLVTFDGTTLVAYVDGTVWLTATATGTYIRSSNLKIGTSGSEISNFFGGVVDQVAVYGRVLNANEVQAWFRSRMPAVGASFARPSLAGVPTQVRAASDGKYLVSSFTYDAYGNLLSASDRGESKARQPDQKLYLDMETLASTAALKDLSGSGKDGTITATSSVEGRWGLARRFGGTGSDYVTTPDIDLSLPFTVAAWIKRDGTQADSAGDVIDKDTNYQLKVFNDGTVQAGYNDGTAWRTLSTASGAAPSGVYAHVAATYVANGGNTFLTVYVNGGIVAGPTSLTGQPRLNDNQVFIGKHSWAVTEDYKGDVDEVYLYSRGLVVGEIGSLVIDGLNVTRVSYSDLYGSAYLTRTLRPDGRAQTLSYDKDTGAPLGVLTTDCKRMRNEYDAGGRPVANAVYDADSSTKVMLDMETPDAAFTPSKLMDVSCSGSSGTIVAGASPLAEVAGVQGKARSFDGDDYLDLGDPASVDFGSGPFTLAAWVKLSSLTQTRGMILAKDNSGSGQRQFTLEWDPDNNNNNRLRIGYYKATDSAVYAVTALNVITDLNWHHIAAGRSGSVFFLYVDGQSKSLTTTGTHGAMQATAAALRVGNRQYAGSTDEINAVLDEIQILSRALSQSEIRDLVNLRFKLFARTYQAFDDMTASTAWIGYQFHSVTTYDAVSIPRRLALDMDTRKVAVGGTLFLEDLSGHGNHVANQGAFESSTNCKVGKCYRFDGAASFMTLPTTTSLNFDRQMSGSAWVWVDASGSVDGSTYAILAKGLSGSDYQYKMYVKRVGSSWYFKVDLKNVLGTAATATSGTISTGALVHVAFTYDGTTIQTYVNGVSSGSAVGLAGPMRTTTYNFNVGKYSSTVEYFKGYIDEIQLFDRALSGSGTCTSSGGTDVCNVYRSVPGSVLEKSHVSRESYDGLGRANRTVTRDFFGTSLEGKADLYWDDLVQKTYLPAATGESNKFASYTQDFPGRPVTATSPSGTGVPAGVGYTNFFDRARKAESVDPVGRRLYEKTDLLGRGTETGVWNTATLAYGNVSKVTYNGLGQVVRTEDPLQRAVTHYYANLAQETFAIYPGSRTSAISYDNNLRTASFTDEMGRVMAFTYDALGRVAKASVKASPTAPTSYETTYAYDGGDNLASIKNGTASIYRQFDLLHHLTKEYFAMPASSPTSNLSVGYLYDAAGRVTEITYQDGTTKAFYTYDSLSRPVAVGFGATNLKQAEIAYDGAGRVDYVHYFEDGTDIGLYEDYAYDIRDRVKEIRVYKGTTDYLKLIYAYNTASEITHVDDNAGSGVKTHDYVYDGSGQLVRAVGPWGANEASVTITYAYDAAGNLLSKTDGGVTTTYTYLAGHWNELNKTVVGSTTRFFDYNADGSAIKSTIQGGAVTSYTYDFAQRLVKIVDSAGTHTYEYDGTGRRLKTTEPGSVTRYFVLSGGQSLGYKEGSTNAFFVYLGDRLVLRKTGTNENRYYFQDLSSNVRMIAWYGTAVNVDLKARYKPFGEIVVISDSSPSPVVFKFAGQQLDASGLYHMGARFYNASLGRFLSRDPLGSGYAYAGNNPLSFYDPTGAVVYRQPVNDATWWAPPGSLIGAIIGTLAAVFQPVTDAVNGLLHDVWNALPPSWRATGTAIADAWNSLDPNVRGAIVLVATVVAIVATGGIAAFAAPLAGTALGSVLVTASIGAAIGAVTDAIVYTGLTLATGGQWSLEGMANAAAFGALVGGVTAGGMKAFSLWRAGAFAGRVGALADGASIARFGTKAETLSHVRANYGEGPLRSSMLKFFGGATSKATNFEIRALERGGYRLSFFSPARTVGYGKLYVSELDKTGILLREFKDTLGPAGELLMRKWIHGGP